MRVIDTRPRRNRRIRKGLFGPRVYWMFALPALAASWHFAFAPKPGGSATKSMRAGLLAAGQVESEPSEVPAEPETEPQVTAEQMQRLTAELQALCANVPARRAAIYVQEIETGLTASVNPNRHFLAASLIKLPVMAAAFQTWEKRPERKTRTALTWLEWMMTVSDNASTDRLIDMVGGPEVVTSLCARRGWENLQVRHAILNHRGRRGLNLCTAREVTEFLVALDRRELISEEADEEMWQVMLRSRKLLRIPAGVPKLPGVEVGNKSGTLGNVLHDAAIVRTPRTRYALCILLSGQRSESAGNRFCQQVSRVVFDTLHGPADTSEEVTASN